MDQKISIFIPVYKESDLLPTLLQGLLNDPYDQKEIFVIVDEPTKKSLEISEELGSDVKFILNGKRKGKAYVLNEAVKESSGDILLFLDADITPPNPYHLLNSVSEEMKNADIIEIKKNVIRDSFLARVINYDYLSFNSTNWIFSRTLGRCLGFNGAAFAIKRKAFESLSGFRRVVSEDLDMGIRSFINDCNFKYINKVQVYNKVPSSWNEWFRQRKRWGIGAALWLKEHYKELLLVVRKNPKVLLSLLLIFPSLPLFVTNMLVPNEIYLKIISILLLFLATKAGLLLHPILFTSIGVALIKNAFASVASFVVYSLLFYYLARKLRYAFNPLEFTVFYFIYSPLWLLIIIASIIKVAINHDKVDIDWKI